MSEILGIRGYSGGGVRRRGRDAERDAVLDLRQMQLALDELLYARAHTPHSGLPHPTLNGLKLTPMEVYTSDLLAGVPLRITCDINLIYEFLPTISRVPSSSGVEWGGLRYVGPGLATISKTHFGDLRRPGRPMTFHVDKHDRSRIFFHEPRSMRWHVLRAVGSEGEEFPPFTDLMRERLMELSARPRPTGHRQDHIKSLYLDMVHKFAADNAGRGLLAREWAALGRALPDPGGTDGPTPTVRIPMQNAFSPPAEEVLDDLDQYDLDLYTTRPDDLEDQTDESDVQP